jgi:arylsulfatase A-like enzyme
MVTKRNKSQKKVAGAPRHRRSLWLGVVAVSVVVVAGMVGFWKLYRSGPVPPTVVVFLLDTVRRDALGCYGHPADPTPNVDAVAADGVRFDQAVSTSGWTLPAVASLMTGTWPTIHGAMGRGVSLRPVRPELPMAAEVLKEAGFGTVGFANAAFVSPMVGLDRGFDLFDHRYSYNWDARDADETVDAAIEQLRRRKSKSSFYFIHVFDPHLDYGAPADFTDRFSGGRSRPATPLTMEDILDLQTGPDRRDPPVADDIEYVRNMYEAEVAFTDANVGRFVDELKALGLYDKCTIVITSDHGEEFWDHGGFEHGHTLYDELVVVPLIIKPPAEIEPSIRVVAAQVRLLDVMPTVFELLSVAKPESFEGVSLMPYMKGDVGSDLLALCESTLYGPRYVALRAPRYKYIHRLEGEGNGEGELFDWRDDPGETKDLASELPEIARQLRSELITMYNGNAARAKGMSMPKVVDLSPARIRQLRSLGYIR